MEDSYPIERFSRLDESDDPGFYADERLVSHLDDRALRTVEQIIASLVIEEVPLILDLMASWDSHLPGSIHPARMVGLGLNINELQANPVLTERVIHDLNADPKLPFESKSFDVVQNVVSADYLVQPLEVFAEVGRVLKPGGLFLVVFSNRWFEPKVTEIWRLASEIERVYLVQDWFRARDLFGSQATFVSQGLPRPKDDKYAHLGLPSDPIYAVWAERKGGDPDRESRPYPVLDLGGSIDKAQLDLLVKELPESLRCPHCFQSLKKWSVPQTPFTEWDNEFMYVCFNDQCPYLLRGFQEMSRQGNLGSSYRFRYNPENGSVGPIMVQDFKMLKDGIVDD